MKTPIFNRLARWSAAFGFAGFGLVVSALAQSDDNSGFDRYFGLQKVSTDDDWTRHFRIGAVVGLNISANFNESGVFNVSGNNPAAGIYDDGYVREDQTGNAGGITTYWGYNNASQYNAAAQTLTFNSTSTFTTSGSDKVNSGPSAGFDLAYGDNLWYWGRIRIGWELGFDLLPISITDHEALSASVDQTTYIFKTGGTVLPGAGYQGSYSGPGPTISTQGSTSSTQTTSGSITGSRTLDAMLYAVRLGPSLYCDLTPRIGVELAGGPAVGVVTGDYTYNETVTVGGIPAHNTGGFGGTDFIFGGNISGTVLFHFQDNNRNADIFVGAAYAPMGKASFSSGGREAQLNFGGQVYLTAGINWPF
jgi:hypothetical protein